MDPAANSNRMSPFEAVMWEVERDPHLSSAFSNLTILDRPPDRTVLRTRIARATVVVPRLRQRVVPAANRFAPPEWRHDPDFDLDHHLRWVHLGGAATMDDLYEFAAKEYQRPFDRERPLWEFVVIEGLESGRAAMLQRFHHTIADGKAGIRISAQFLDLERHPAPVEHSDPAADQAADAATDPGEPDGENHVDSWWGRNAQAFGHTAGQVRDTAVGVGGLLSRPGEIPSRVSDVADMALSTLRQVRVDSRRSPLWTERSLTRWFGTTDVFLDDVRNASHALGGSINDFFVAGAVEAAARHHERHGAAVDELRVSMPVSTRTKGDVGGNAFAPTQSLLPTGAMSPAERFVAVHDVLEVTKHESARTSVDAAATAVALLPRSAVVMTSQRMTGAVDFVVSNVKAAPFDLYIAGAFMESNYPMGPLAGTAFNLTTMSYRGWLFLGLMVDHAAVTDPEGLLKDLNAAYRDLMRSGGVRRRTLTDNRVS